MALTDSRGLWTKQVEGDYQAFRRRLQLFTGEHQAYFDAAGEARQLFRYEVRNWLGDRLTTRVAELVFPGFPRIFAAVERDRKLATGLIEALRLEELVYPTALMVSWAGSATWKVYWSPALGGPAVRLWGTEEGEFAVWDFHAGDHACPYAVNFWYRTETGGESFRVNERYGRFGDGVEVESRAFREKGFGGELEPVPIGQAFPADVAAPPAGRLAMRGLTLLPGYSIPNVDLFGRATGASDYTEGLIQIQRQVNRVSAQRALVIALTGLPQFRIPKRLIKPDGTVDLRSIWLQIEYEGEKDTPIRIENWEGNLKNTAEELANLNEEFIRSSVLSPAIDGQAAGGGESGYARRLGLVKLEGGVHRRRAPYGRAFEWVLRAAQECAAAQSGRRPRLVGNVSVLWPPAIPEDPEASALTVQAARLAGAMSLERAVRVLDPTEPNDWVAEEVERIRGERESGSGAGPERRA